MAVRFPNKLKNIKASGKIIASFLRNKHRLIAVTNCIKKLSKK